MALLQKTIQSVKPIYKNLPAPLQSFLRFLYRCLDYVPFTENFYRRRWILNTYIPYSLEQRRTIFQAIARFCNVNRPIDGYYFEFGCHGANTMRMAFDFSRYLFDWTFVAFDSFEGLPEIEEIDKQAIWAKGKLATSEETFRHIVESHGMPREKLLTVKGFYNESLTPELTKKLLPKKAVVIYVDCDLYQSTVDVLRFSKSFLQRGTIIVFDDWFCFHGDPRRGERLAFSEFQAANPELVFEEFVQTNEAKAFIYLGTKQELGV